MNPTPLLHSHGAAVARSSAAERSLAVAGIALPVGLIAVLASGVRRPR